MSAQPKHRAEPYRMKDLCRLTGLPRQVIHFYIQQGLVPEGHKTGRNMAYYGDEHVRRVRLVRTLQHERFLPLKASRALLERTTNPTEHEVRYWLAGNLCRCTGYDKIVTAVMDAASAMRSGLRG